ncbi:MAG: polyribonucleotide nucleotidyltransferase [Firmicutes bacterium]|nr:polyribonucleotide nucleotidyltransferase [Bacillota bacterium]
MENKIYETKIGGRDVSVQVGKYAQLSNGSCILRCGETVVMVNANVAASPRDGVDFMPLSCDFEEKMYAIGKIPGGWKRREGRPSDKAILVARLIDRPLRPLFPKDFFNDITVVATALSVDQDIAPEPLAMLGSSIALSLSSAPFQGPTGSVIVGMVDGQFVINPDTKQREASKLHLTVSATKDAILMVEAAANEISEENMLAAIGFAHEEIKKQVAFQEQIIKENGKAKVEFVSAFDAPEIPELKKELEKFAKTEVLALLETKDNKVMKQGMAKLVDEAIAKFAADKPELKHIIHEILWEDVFKGNLTERSIKGSRLDGRKHDEIRDIWCEVRLLPRVHGSGVFTRGQTQALTTCTLGMLSDNQVLEGLDDEEEKRYMHHYNMPPYATGEAKMLRSAGRREIGHGALAERALEPVLPSEEEFPYSIRTVSEVLSSNGSSSQASVCGSTLALMDAGVPIRSPVAGIAMGLMKHPGSGKVVVLSDIVGEEDHFGDMDFKVAGTFEGITAIQMDIKIKGIDADVLKTALKQAKDGRIHILNKMLAVMPAPRAEVSKYAPKIINFSIDPEKIGDVVGKSGKTINKIIEQTGVKIDIEDDGRVFVASSDAEMLAKAKEIIMSIVTDPAPGMKAQGVVVKIMPFGAFVEYGFNGDGMIHISKLSNKRVEKVEDVVKVGDEVLVEVIKVDDRGKIDLKLLEKIAK